MLGENMRKKTKNIPEWNEFDEVILPPNKKQFLVGDLSKPIPRKVVAENWGEAWEIYKATYKVDIDEKGLFKIYELKNGVLVLDTKVEVTTGLK
jgi:hypothetical protein